MANATARQWRTAWRVTVLWLCTAITPTLALAATSRPTSQPAVKSTPAGPPELGKLLPLETGLLFVPARLQPAASMDLLVHFHGDPLTVARNVHKAELACAVVIVNYPGLSAAYSKPLQDSTLFASILADALRTLKTQHPPITRWGKISVSSFSAGYGAVRELLRQKSWFERIDGILLADSLYAGYAGEGESRQVDPRNMADFRAFAKAAAQGRKTLILTHSYLVPGKYASTIETADDLIAWIGGKRESVRPNTDDPVPIVSRCERGNFHLYGWPGTDGEAHMRHLREIHRHLGQLPWSDQPRTTSRPHHQNPE